jgi:Leucine Rich repeat
LRRVVAHIPQPHEAPWETAAGKRLAVAVSCAPEALQRAALSGCAVHLLSSAPLAVLRPALAARCAPVGDAQDGTRHMTLDLLAALLTTALAAARIAEAFAALPQIERLTIRKLRVDHARSHGCYDERIYDKPLWVPQLAAAIAALPGLVALRLRNPQLNRKTLTALSAALPRGLRAFECDWLDVSFIPQRILGVRIAACTGLVHVGIASCRLMRDADVAELAKLSGLERLDLTDCGSVTSNALSHLAVSPTASTGLTRLDIWDCKVSDSGLASIANLAALRYLTIGGYHSNYTASGFAHLQPLAPTLRVLSASNCKMNDVGLAHVADLTCLVELYVDSNENVTDAGLAKLTILLHLQVCFAQLAANLCFAFAMATPSDGSMPSSSAQQCLPFHSELK